MRPPVLVERLASAVRPTLPGLQVVFRRAVLPRAAPRQRGGTSAGDAATGGTQATGGAPAGGGTKNSGGTSASGGNPAGGSTASAGNTAIGGSAGSFATGGKSATGGSNTGGASSTGGSSAGHWVGTWTASPYYDSANQPPASLSNSVLRQVAHVSLGSSQIRVQFSNLFGNGPVTINSAHIAICRATPAVDSTIDTTTDKALAFSGTASVTIAQGKEIWSDPIDFTIAPLGQHFDYHRLRERSQQCLWTLGIEDHVLPTDRQHQRQRGQHDIRDERPPTGTISRASTLWRMLRLQASSRLAIPLPTVGVRIQTRTIGGRTIWLHACRAMLRLRMWR